MAEKQESLYALAAKAVLLLVLCFLPPPHRIGHARLVTNGRLRLWPQWNTLTEAEQQLIGRYWRLQPQELARDTILAAEAKRLLDKRDFRTVSEPPAEDWPGKFDSRDRHARERLWELEFSVISGELDRPIEDALRELEVRKSGRMPSVLQVADGVETLHLRTFGQHFSIPRNHLPHKVAFDCPTLRTAAAHNALAVDLDELVGLAKALGEVDARLSYYYEALVTMHSQLQDGEGTRPVGGYLQLESGPTQLLAAPTGRGKNLLARLAAIAWATKGIPVALAVTSAQDTIKECMELEQCMRALNLQFRIAPVNAARRLFKAVEESLTGDLLDEGVKQWTLERLSYYCRLSAYTEDVEGIAPGEEPCFSLKTTSQRDVTCPFANGCPRHDSYRLAVDADILVINHHALFMGRMPVPVKIQGKIVHKLPFMEVVLRGYSVLLIDEIDQFQNIVLQQSTRALPLSAGGMQPRATAELLRELEAHYLDLPGEGYVEQSSGLLHTVNHFGNLLTKEINEDRLHWPDRDHFRSHTANDAKIAQVLYGQDADLQLVQSLFDTRPIQDQPYAEDLRSLLVEWTQSRIDGEDSGWRRGQLIAILETWPAPEGEGNFSRKEISRLADRLTLRAFLGRLSQVLNQLLPKTIPLDQFGLEYAEKVRDALLGYLPWMPSPLGPLGRRILGFGIRAPHAGPRLLEVRAFTGDPHGFIRGLGLDSALALAGCRRIVLGFSATGRFPGAVRYDVLGRLAAFQPDAGEDISLSPCHISEPESENTIRVSGIGHVEQRHRQVRKLAGELWDRVLAAHLTSLASNKLTAHRARALLTTGSYAEAREVAQGLAVAIGNVAEVRRRVRLVQREPGDSTDPVPIITRRELTRYAHSEADVLIAPLSVIARGYNILCPDSRESAISSIFVLVRPVPQVGDPSEMLGYTSYQTNRTSIEAAEINEAIALERSLANRAMHRLQSAIGPFSRLPRAIRHQVFCSVLVDIVQLAGRARRGGTNVNMYLVDGAFGHEEVGWQKLIKETFDIWRESGDLPRMQQLHGALLKALARFAGVEEKLL